jgi:ElaA protein
MISITVKPYKDLSIDELYSLLRLRSEVFVVEQNCVYQDMDEKDKKAIHILGLKNNEIVAYARIFKPDDYFKEASIGRVVVSQKERGSGLGYKIMNASIKAILDEFQEYNIKVSAQKYLKKFYNNLGFKQVGEEYLEDGIPHIAMIKN